MRRVSLALALMGAVTAAGCSGGAKSSGSGTERGVSEGTFTVVVQNGQSINGTTANPSLAIKGGYVTSTPAGLDCGVGTHTACSATFPYDQVVVLTATVTDTKYIFWGWAGDCSGNTCELTGKADKYILAQFDTATNGQHPDYSDPAVHSAAYSAHVLDCRSCHGAALQGAGIAVACTSCHQPELNAKGQAVEQCGGCHAGEAKKLHQDIYNKYTDASKLVATIDSVASTGLGTVPETYKSVLTFTLTKDGAPYVDATLSGLKQKRYAAVRYDPATKSFETASAITYGSLKSLGSGKYTVEKTGTQFAPESSNAFVYLYFGDTLILPAGGRYSLMDNVASVGRVFGTIDWTSTANVSGCEKCHGSPYMKHGYRAGAVAGLPDMVACKACHTDQRGGVDFNLAMAYEDPARLAAIEAQGAVCGGELCWSAADEATYAYTANTMSDTHMSHAKEFLYPQSMAGCATCHEGKLDRILTDANFTGSVCKSCHPIVAANGDDPKRAPKLVIPYHDFDWSDGTIVETDGTKLACNTCHSVDPATGTNRVMYGNTVPLFKDLHRGYDPIVYADAAGTRYSTSIRTQIDSVSRAGNVLTINFSLSGAAAGAIMKPTVVLSLYGYDTKDFVVSGHGNAADGKRNLEWTEGATSNATRLTVSPATAAAGITSWTATADLTLWASKLTDGSVKKVEIGVLPALGIDQTKAPDNAATTTTGGVTSTNPSYNPYLAIAGAVRTYDLVADVLMADADVYGKAIVDAAKCNKCHDALGTSFHSPAYGSAGVVACRLCHVVGNGGAHLEMQSRSIDSYVHAIHSFQAFDINKINFADTVGAFEYEHHIGSTYPNFTTLSCESCHNAGTYEVPDQTRSLAGILSASSTVTGKSRAITGVPSVVTGPASRACGGCHRAELIKLDDAAGLGAFDQHTADFGYRVTNGTGVLDGIIKNVMEP